MTGAIASRSNAKVKSVRRLQSRKGRSASGLSFVEGPKLRDELLASDIEPVLFVAKESDGSTIEIAQGAGHEHIVVTDDVFASVADSATPQSPVTVFRVPENGASLAGTNTVVLVDVADPGNVGTIIRTAAALGWGVAYAGTTADPWSPKALRSAAGATLRTRLVHLEDPISDVRQAGLQPMATVVSGGDPPATLSRPVALFIGSEAHGLPVGIVDAADRCVTIPIHAGSESLNAAVAAAILMYAFSAGER